MAISLISSDGRVLVSISALLDIPPINGKECMFVDKEFSEEKYLVFRFLGSFKYVIENKTNLVLDFSLEDISGNVMKTVNYVEPYSVLNVHCYSETDQTQFKIEIKDLIGTWKLTEANVEEKITNYEKQNGSSSFIFSHLYKNNLIFLPVVNEKQYVENHCCICLKPEYEDLCTLMKCGHRCVHMDCFFNNGRPNFNRCPLCRSNIIAISA
jgi:hypothetical protein